MIVNERVERLVRELGNGPLAHRVANTLGKEANDMNQNIREELSSRAAACSSDGGESHAAPTFTEDKRYERRSLERSFVKSAAAAEEACCENRRRVLHALRVELI